MEKLDNLTAEELWDFWAKYHHCRRKDARVFFPNMTKGHVKNLGLLCHYAANLGTYLSSKEDCYKVIAEKIYNTLPNDAKKLIR